MTQTVDVPGVGPVDFPDGMNAADMGAAIQRSFPNLSKYQNTKFPVQLGPEGMKQSIRETLASDVSPTGAGIIGGAGTAVNDAAMRLKQFVMGKDQLTPQETADIHGGRQLREVSTPAKLGAVAGQVGMTYPIAPTTLLGNIAAGGAIGGAMEPVLEGESTAENVKRGAVGGGLGYGALKLAGALAQPVVQSPAVQKLLNEGIVPTIGQAARDTKTLLGRSLGGIEDAATSLPIIGDLIKGARGRNVEELQTAALRRATPKEVPGIAIPADITTPTKAIARTGLAETGDKISDAYGLALDKIGTVKLDQQFLGSGPKIVQAAVGLNPEQRATLSNTIEQVISSRINPAGGAVPADVAKLIDSDLGSYARDSANSSVASEREAGKALRLVQAEWRDMIRRNAPDAATANLLDEANRAHANYLRVERATGKQGATSGEYSPAQLSQAVREMTSGAGKRQFAQGKALMQDLSDPAKQVLSGKLNESGTVPRAIMTMAALGGGGAGLNEKMEGPDWVTKAALAAALLGPAYSRAGSRYALGDLLPLLQQPTSKLLRASAPAAGQLGRSLMLQQGE